MATDRQRSRWAKAVVGAVLVALLAAPAAEGAKRKKKGKDPAELVHPFLSPRYSAWLVGPIAHLASDAEIRAYLAVADDAEAAAFIETFWDGRDPEPEFPGNPLREDFDDRIREADKEFGEGMTPGHRTERGTLFVIYGEPTERRIDYPRKPGAGAAEIWTYGPDHPVGLDGSEPKRFYRFEKEGQRRGPTRRPGRPGGR